VAISRETREREGDTDDEHRISLPTPADAAQPNLAQLCRVESIRQGDPCQGNGSTAVNEKGQAFDFEALGSDLSRDVTGERHPLRLSHPERRAVP
jgi:hypothetical protein